MSSKTEQPAVQGQVDELDDVDSQKLEGKTEQTDAHADDREERDSQTHDLKVAASDLEGKTEKEDIQMDHLRQINFQELDAKLETPVCSNNDPPGIDTSGTTQEREIVPTHELTWESFVKDTTRGWQKLMLAKNIVAALWAPAVLMANKSMSRWIFAMAIAHTVLVLVMAWHSGWRLLELQSDQSRPVALANRRVRQSAPPFGAWVRLVFACSIGALVIGTHIGGLTSHYDSTCLAKISCWRAWVLTVSFCIGSSSLAIQYVYSAWVFLRSGVRISYFLHTATAFIMNEEAPNEKRKTD